MRPLQVDVRTLLVPDQRQRGLAQQSGVKYYLVHKCGVTWRSSQGLPNMSPPTASPSPTCPHPVNTHCNMGLCRQQTQTCVFSDLHPRRVVAGVPEVALAGQARHPHRGPQRGRGRQLQQRHVVSAVRTATATLHVTCHTCPTCQGQHLSYSGCTNLAAILMTSLPGSSWSRLSWLPTITLIELSTNLRALIFAKVR